MNQLKLDDGSSSVLLEWTLVRVMETEMQKPMKLTQSEALLALSAHASPARRDYLAMYSTWLGGIVTDSELMFVPVDDHLVHRGDGVFEAIKCIEGKVYLLQPHLERLVRSANAIELTLPFSIETIREICAATLACAIDEADLRAAQYEKSGQKSGQASVQDFNSTSGQKSDQNFMLRLYVSRGPGGFTANPYESIGAQLYMVITRYKPMPDSKYMAGVRIGLSRFGVKEGRFAQIKSCNYLPNVLMKKEAVDRQLDFTISVDEEGFLAESSTENFAMISESNEFLMPRFDRTLRGITAVRVMELARELVSRGELASIGHMDIRPADVALAREAMMIGTTLDVLPVVEFEGREIGNGHPGINTSNLLKMLRNDIAAGGFI